MSASESAAERPSPASTSGAEGAYLFLFLACAITWALDVPIALAIMRKTQPTPGAMAMAGLSAFGPTLAALAIAAPRRELGKVFGKWRTNPIWIVLGLFSMPMLHSIANLIEVALGGKPAHWFYPPVLPEQIAALVFFSVGEEFGWRGFAYPRLAKRHGPVIGSLILGVAWGLWHFVMWFTADGPPKLTMLGIGIANMMLGSILFAWVFERGGRSMAVAIALHASAHLDNDFRAPDSEVRLRILRFAVLATAAFFAARSLARTKLPE